MKKKNTLLIVDDEMANLKVLTHILGPEYTIYTATDGANGIEKAKEYIPDLILLDVLMPEMDGYQTLYELKKHEETKDIPVIFITGLNSIEDEEKALNLEAADFIHKPFSANIVKLRVKNQIQIINQIRELVKLHGDFENAARSAETANRFKPTFLANMGQEVRTSLNAILGIAEIQLYNENLQENIKDAFIRIFNSGDLLLGIVNDMIDMSRLEAGKLELSSAQYDLANMLNDVVFKNKIKYENKSVEFIINVDENVPSALYGDENRIKQILNNLLSYVFNYTDSGEIELAVSAENSAGTVTLILRVHGTGQGMTPEQVSKLFDGYSHFNTKVNRTADGTVPGMSIVWNLINIMNGKILAESLPNKGLLFTVRLPQGNTGAPVLDREAAEKLRQFHSNNNAKMKKTQIAHEQIPFGRVLVVDDVDINLYVAEGMLSSYGLKVDTAASGDEAVEKVKSAPYNIVFMDHMMPKKDGVQTTREIRKLGQEYKNLPIIALTSNAIPSAEEMYQTLGFDGFLPKPLSMQELDAILKKWMHDGQKPSV